MKATIMLVLLSCGSALAASVTSNYTCIMGHESQATAKLQALATEALSNFFKNKKIEINPSTLHFDVNLAIQTNFGGVPYAAFTGNSGGDSGFAGSITAKDGTKFNVLLSSGSDEQSTGEYRIITSQKGFDHEGNPLNRHCQLELFSSGDVDASKTLLVLNANSGHVLGLIPLPRQIELY